jgi:hypothetical protein
MQQLHGWNAELLGHGLQHNIQNKISHQHFSYITYALNYITT